MIQKIQSTNLRRSLSQALERLAVWAINPWRRYSLFTIVLLAGFLLGSSVGMINGVLALMDPIGAFLIVALLEVMVRLRRFWPASSGARLSLHIIDLLRMGLLYGLITESFKLF